MFGHLPATLPHAIRTGSWLAREVLSNTRGVGRYAVALTVTAAALALAPLGAQGARTSHSQRAAPTAPPRLPAARPVPYPRLAWQPDRGGSQAAPDALGELAGRRGA